MSSLTLASQKPELMAGALAPAPVRLPAIPWRDPHTVSPERLAAIIGSLEEACAQDPASADLRVCLGMAHAMNYDAYASMDALEQARAIDPTNFLAQFKFSELLYRLRALHRAETETLHALELAETHWEFAQARRQLSEIRRLAREGSMKPGWTKSLFIPMLCLGLIMGVISLLFTVIR